MSHESTFDVAEPRSPDVDLRRLVEWAKDSLDAWRRTLGMTLVHTVFGEGVILNVAKSESGIRIDIKFLDDDKDSRTFSNRNLGNFTGAVLTHALGNFLHEQVGPIEVERDEHEKAEREWKEKEEQNAKEFSKQLALRLRLEEESRLRLYAEREKILGTQRDLFSKYFVNPTDYEVPELLPIIERLEAQCFLSSEEIAYLEEHNHYGAVAVNWERKFEVSRDGWDAAKSSKHYRKCTQPRQAVNVAQMALAMVRDEPRNRPAIAALHTTLGAALLEIGDVDAAYSNAMKAIELNQNTPHPHNVLGKTFYAKGMLSEGDAEFMVAMLLGSEPQSREYHIREVMKFVDEKTQRLITEHLHGTTAN